MKKRISQLAALSLAGVMVVGLAACGSGSKGGGSAAKEGGSSGDTNVFIIRSSLHKRYSIRNLSINWMSLWRVTTKRW